MTPEQRGQIVELVKDRWGHNAVNFPPSIVALICSELSDQELKRSADVLLTPEELSEVFNAQ